MKKWLLIIWCSLGCLVLRAQSPQRADELFQQQQYAEAGQLYADLLKKQPQQVLYLYRYARCLQETGNTTLAIDYFIQAGDKYPLRNFYLGELYFSRYQFSEAAEHYQYYLETIQPSHERYDYTTQQIALCSKAERYLKRVEDIVVVDSVILPKATFLSTYHLSAEAGTLTVQNGLVEYLNQRGDKRTFPVLDDAGKTSLVTCQRLLESWSEYDTLPQNINSAFNENYPFVLADGLTLYFASDRPEGLGGYDIWITKYNTETDTWVAPENAGMPFNSLRNDYMLAIDENTNTGWFATDRRCADSLVVVYKFVPNPEKTILRGKTDEYIRQAAQLLCFRQQDETEEAAEPVITDLTTEKSEEPAAIFFHLSDTIVYTQLTDFRSYDARLLYITYLSDKDKLQQTAEHLQTLRLQYAAADSDTEKATLAQEIHDLEQTLPNRRKALKAQLNKIYTLELQARKTQL